MSKWEISVVENAGEIPADKVEDVIAVPKAPLLTDIKAQLMLMPISLTYTVGWRAIVWRNKETGQFKDLSEAEFKQYQETGSVPQLEATGEDARPDGRAEGTETSTD
jgi:hypothetical protein